MILRSLALALSLSLMGCSAVEWQRQSADSTSRASSAIDAALERADATAAAQRQDLVATLGAVGASATQAAQMLSTWEGRSTAGEATDRATDSPADGDFSSAELSVYGSVPVDSDRLNTITAMAFDEAGRLLVARRAGQIYRLIDDDGDGLAESSQLIFEDERNEIGQVWSLIARGGRLIVVSQGRLHQLRDSDGDGDYDAGCCPLGRAAGASEHVGGWRRHLESERWAALRGRYSDGRDLADPPAGVKAAFDGPAAQGGMHPVPGRALC